MAKQYGWKNYLDTTFMYKGEPQLLYRLAERTAKQFGPHVRIVNIGVREGGSMFALRAGAPSADLIGIDIDFKGLPMLCPPGGTLIEGDSNVLHKRVSGPVHLLFVDGGHDKKTCKGDIDGWISKVPVGGIVAFHNLTHGAGMKRQRSGTIHAVRDWRAEPGWGDEWRVARSVGSIGVFEHIGERPRILVTGGAGYVGSTLVPHLLRQHEVTVLDSLLYGGEGLLGAFGQLGFRFVKGSVCDAGAVSEAMEKVGTVIHLAAISRRADCRKDPDEARRINHEGTLCVLEQASLAGVERFVLASTCSCYGIGRSGDLASETTPIKPLTIYAQTKQAAEEATLKASGPTFCTTVLRFATVYGLSPRMRFDLVVPKFAYGAVAQGALEIYGPEAWHPHIYVGDLARAVGIVLTADKPWVNGEIFNVTGYNRTKRQLAETLLDLVPSLTVSYMPMGEVKEDFRVDGSKLAALGLGYSPAVTPEDGLHEVVMALRDGVIADV